MLKEFRTQGRIARALMRAEHYTLTRSELRYHIGSQVPTSMLDEAIAVMIDQGVVKSSPYRRNKGPVGTQYHGTDELVGRVRNGYYDGPQRSLSLDIVTQKPTKAAKDAIVATLRDSATGEITVDDVLVNMFPDLEEHRGRVLTEMRDLVQWSIVEHTPTSARETVWKSAIGGES